MSTARLSADVPSGSAIDAIERCVAEHPDRTAVIAEDDRLAYGELDARASSLARRLACSGVGPGSLVGVCLPRSAELVVALLAVHKAGAAYLPLSTTLPSARLAYMLKDSGVQHVVAGAATSLGRASVTRVDVNAPTSREDCDGVPSAARTPEQLAYVIYTSGSTGQPKGVQIEQGALFRILTTMGDVLGVASEDVFLAVSNVSFDIAAIELLLPLMRGAAVALVSESVARDPALLARSLDDVGATVMQATPATWRMLVDYGWTGRPDLRMLSGGETLSRKLADELLRRGAALWNGYGPTEATIYASVGRVYPGGETVTIGTALEGVELEILDDALSPVQPGTSGELYIGGGCLARGYLNRPSLTSARFVYPDALKGRWYRTGDRCRRLADGRLVYEGRLDHQVKVRGHRIELGEVESALARLPGIRQAVVLAHGQESARHLVAYVTSDTGSQAEAASLRAALRTDLPGYMIPSTVLVLERLPTTPNGKIDRAALGRIEQPLVERQPGTPPATETQERLGRIWSEVLGCGAVGVDDDFFELGGQSLQAAVLMARIGDAFDIDLPLATIFSVPTIAELAALVDRNSRDQPRHRMPSVSRDGGLPLSFAQRRLWYLERYEEPGAAYNEPYATDLQGPLDFERLRASIEVVVGRHEALRTTIADTDGEPTQIVLPQSALEWSVIDLSSSQPSSEALDERLREEARRSFRLDQGPIVRGCCVVLSPNRTVFLLVVHHIACDDWSIRLIFREIAAVYMHGADAPSKIGEAPLLHYGDFSSWQRTRVAGARLERQLRYWAERLRGVPTSPPLITDFARPSVLTHQGGCVPLQIDRRESTLLKVFCRERGHAVFPALLAAYGALLARYAGHDDLVIGTPVTQRRGTASQQMVGFMLNMLPLHVDVSGDPSFGELVSRVHAEVLSGMDHQDAPLEQVVERVNPVRGRSHAPLFQVAFTWLEGDQPLLELPSCSSRAHPVHTGTSKYDLMLELWRSGGEIRGRVEFSTDLFHVQTAVQFAEHFSRFLCGALAAPSEPISGIDVLSQEERAALVDGLHQKEDRPYSRDDTLDHLFRERAKCNPESPALLEGDRVFDYASLDSEAERLARVLHEGNVQPGARVAIDIERSAEFVIAALAVLRVGASYVPLDPAAPAVRRRSLLKSVDCVAVLVRSEGSVILDSDIPHLCVDARPTRLNEPLAIPAVSAEDEAYVMFTSGSSGSPKAVAVPHRAIIRLVQAQDYLPFDQHQTLLFHSNTGFDASTVELWGALLHGARLAIARGSECDLRELELLIQRHNVTCLWLTSPLFCAMVDEMPDALQSLAWIITGGEALSVAHVRRGLCALPDTTIVNGYGPTETVTFACTHRIPRVLDAAVRSIPIGRPLANTRAYVLDSHQRPVPYGVPGELYIGGDAVALGYANDRELTLRRFLPDPFDPTPGARMYRTGDLCRQLRSEVIEFLGRIDDQVKIRGFRIEPGEIRAALSSHDHVLQAVIVATGTPEDRRLVAYVTALPPEPTGTELRGYLLDRLPSYMIPSSFIFLEQMPLTRNGKVDLARLPSCTPIPKVQGTLASVPGDEVERQMLSIWRELLDAEAVGLDDSFFSLGGHSLLAARFVARFSREFDVVLSINEFLQYPTIRSLAARLRAPSPSATYVAVPVQPAGDRPPLFFLPGLGGSAFVLPDLSRHLGPDQPIYALEARGGDHPPSIEKLAAVCVESVRAVRPAGPYHLAGFSLGGSLAYEAAQQLCASGQEVGLLAIIDHAPANLSWNLTALRLALANIPFWVAQVVRHPPRRPLAVIGRKLRALAVHLRGERVRVDDVVDLSEWSEEMHTIASAQYDAYRAYVPRPYPGGVFLVRAKRQPLHEPMRCDNGWGRLARDGVEVLTIPGGHLSILERPGLERIGPRLKELLDGSCLRPRGGLV